MVYIDLDNFKTVNDTLGHSTGDQVLKSVVHFFRKHLRETDVTARLGGDEFALLLPETGIEESKVVLGKLHDNFQVEMNRNNWPITLSMGSVTCEKMPSSIDTLLNFADELMYSVKHKSKNSIKYSVYPEGKCNKEI